MTKQHWHGTTKAGTACGVRSSRIAGSTEEITCRSCVVAAMYAYLPGNWPKNAAQLPATPGPRLQAQFDAWNQDNVMVTTCERCLRDIDCLAASCSSCSYRHVPGEAISGWHLYPRDQWQPGRRAIELPATPKSAPVALRLIRSPR